MKSKAIKGTMYDNTNSAVTDFCFTIELSVNVCASLLLHFALFITDDNFINEIRNIRIIKTMLKYSVITNERCSTMLLISMNSTATQRGENDVKSKQIDWKYDIKIQPHDHGLVPLTSTGYSLIG